MNALANSQLEELDKFLHGYDDLDHPITVARYTGQESTAERERIAKCAPDILLTNFMMLEYILTRYTETDRQVIEHCAGLEFLVLDELHTYRGRQGADVALLVRRLRERLNADRLVCIGTSATMSSAASESERNRVVVEVASKLFGTRITEHEVIGETRKGSQTQTGISTPYASTCSRQSNANSTHGPITRRFRTTRSPSGWN